MKKIFPRFCASALIILFCVGCANYVSVPSSAPVSAISSFPISSSALPSESSSVSDSAVSGSVSEYISQWGSQDPVPVESDPGYFIFIEGTLVGSYHDNRWYSIEKRDISIADLLKQGAYYCYNQTRLIGVSNKLTFNYIFDFGCSFKDDPQPLFQYADKNDTKNENLTFNLPCKTLQDLHYIRFNSYNGDVEFDGYSSTLTLSADFNPLPKTEVKKLAEPYSEADKSAIKAELTRLGIPGAPVNITECYDFDYNGNGITEHFIIANAPKEKEGFQQPPYYYMVLCKDGSGYKTVTSWCFTHQDDTAMQSVNLIGMYDLNDDGIYELCLDNPEWEGYKILVFSLNKNSEWECVLTGSGGM